MPVDPPVHARLPLTALAEGDSPRLAGEDAEHVKLLAAIDGPLPPVLVHRPTMRVVDGMHRLRAARLRGDETIGVVYLDCGDEDVFVGAVQANIRHGKPLTLADREAAAARIVQSHPRSSDRAIAAIAGLAPHTVATIRRRLTSGDDQAESRVGRDGRVRPMHSAEARRKASAFLQANPDASLRQVARATGLSPTTVRDVRDRMRRGDDPVPSGPRRRIEGVRAVHKGPNATVGRGRFGAVASDHRRLLQDLNRDPSLRFSESGRALLRWLSSKSAGPDEGVELIDMMPPHCTYVVAEVARGIAEEWSAFADRLEQRQRSSA